MKKCPRCGSKKAVPILHDYLTQDKELLQKLERGELAWPGYYDSCNLPKYHCFACGKDFGTQPFFNDKRYREDHQDIVTGVFFADGGYFGGYDEVTIQKTGDVIVMNCDPSFERRTQPVSRQMTDEEWRRLLNRLFAGLFVHEWEETYIDPDILDGEQWELKIILDNGGVLERSGSNAFPPYWGELKRTFKRFLDEGAMKIRPFLTRDEDDGFVIFGLERVGKPNVYVWVTNSGDAVNSVLRVTSFYGVVSGFTHSGEPLTIARFAQHEHIKKAEQRLRSYPREEFIALLKEADEEIEQKRNDPDGWKEYIEWEKGAMELIEEVANRGETKIII